MDDDFRPGTNGFKVTALIGNFCISDNMEIGKELNYWPDVDLQQ